MSPAVEWQDMVLAGGEEINIPRDDHLVIAFGVEEGDGFLGIFFVTGKKLVAAREKSAVGIFQSFSLRVVTQGANPSVEDVFGNGHGVFTAYEASL